MLKFTVKDLELLNSVLDESFNSPHNKSLGAQKNDIRRKMSGKQSPYKQAVWIPKLINALAVSVQSLLPPPHLSSLQYSSLWHRLSQSGLRRCVRTSKHSLLIYWSVCEGRKWTTTLKRITTGNSALFAFWSLLGGLIACLKSLVHINSSPASSLLPTCFCFSSNLSQLYRSLFCQWRQSQYVALTPSELAGAAPEEPFHCAVRTAH